MVVFEPVQECHRLLTQVRCDALAAGNGGARGVQSLAHRGEILDHDVHLAEDLDERVRQLVQFPGIGVTPDLEKE